MSDTTDPTTRPSDDPGRHVAAVAADRQDDVTADDVRRDGTATGSAAGHDPADHDASPADDDSVGHVFDQTNGVVEGLEGEADGTAEGDGASAADRGGLNEPNPIGQQDAWHEDHYGAEDGRDLNP